MSSFVTSNPTEMSKCERIAKTSRGQPDLIFKSLNTLSQHAPLGTIFVHGNGSEGSAGPIKAPDNWFWLEPGSRLHSVDLFVSRNYIKVTYKPIILGRSTIYILRVYAIFSSPELPVNSASKRRSGTMKSLLCLMDYSKESWNIKDPSSLMRYMLHTELPIICGDIPLVSRNISHHLQRLKHGLPYSYGPRSEVSVEQRLLKLYDSIPSPQSDSCKVEGITSELFPYQKRSLARMLEMEKSSQRALLCLPFNGGYLDFSTFEVLRTPKAFCTARGGILAENMGLGKTLICLALITSSRWQSSEIPNNVLDNLTKMSGPLRSLSEYSVRELNRNSFSWKGYNLPDSCVKLLSQNPPSFQAEKPQTGRKSKRVISETTQSHSVLLSTTTLIVCPKNIWHQWMAEIDKHVQPGFLKVLGANEPIIPSAQEIVMYDLVVMSTLAFAYHSDHLDSPLRGVHWKRLIVDEGHSMNARHSKAVLMSKDLSVERRWIISGTPTAGLTQLHMNEEAQSEYIVKRKFSAQDDLKRLGSLVEYFFKISPWTTVKWSNTVMRSFFNGTSEDLVQTLLNTLLVRHQIGDVNKEVTLPPLRHEAVFLNPSYHDKLSVNLFISVLAANAVTSERVDQDYMFHPSNRSDLQRLISNLQRATFYWTGFTVNDIEVLLSLCKLALDKETPQGKPYYSSEDRILLSKCVKTSKLALANQRWRTASAIHEMNYFVSGLSDVYSRSFATGTVDHLSVFGAPHLHSAQKIYFKNRFSKGESLEGKIESHSKEFWLAYWRSTEKKNTHRARLGEGQQIDKNAVKEDHKPDTELSYAPMDIPVENTKNASLLGTASAKLSYLGARLMEHQATRTKSIIFFEFEDSAYYLTELLDLLGVDYIMYATFVTPVERSKNLSTFALSEKGIPLIMDLKLASHGLTIIEATRVYFINPIWRKAVEAQAIKRAHRIGQSSSVIVETLILRGTIEEEMYKKHLDVKGETASLIDDSGMQEYVGRHEFLPYNDAKEWEPFVAPLIYGNIPREESGEYSLHSSSCTDHGVWDVPVFSATCLDKITCTEYRAKRAYNEKRKGTKRVRFV